MLSTRSLVPELSPAAWSFATSASGTIHLIALELARDDAAYEEKGGTAYTLGNYFYFIHGLDARTATVWAVPVGPRRDEASSHFVIIGPAELAHWKGAAIKLDEFDKLIPNPDAGELAALGLVRQPDETDSPKKSQEPPRLPSTQSRR